MKNRINHSILHIVLMSTLFLQGKAQHKVFQFSANFQSGLYNTFTATNNTYFNGTLIPSIKGIYKLSKTSFLEANLAAKCNYLSSDSKISTNLYRMTVEWKYSNGEICVGLQHPEFSIAQLLPSINWSNSAHPMNPIPIVEGMTGIRFKQKTSENTGIQLWAFSAQLTPKDGDTYGSVKPHPEIGLQWYLSKESLFASTAFTFRKVRIEHAVSSLRSDIAELDETKWGIQLRYKSSHAAFFAENNFRFCQRYFYLENPVQNKYTLGIELKTNNDIFKFRSEFQRISFGTSITHYSNSSSNIGCLSEVAFTEKNKLSGQIYWLVNQHQHYSQIQYSFKGKKSLWMAACFWNPSVSALAAQDNTLFSGKGLLLAVTLHH